MCCGAIRTWSPSKTLTLIATLQCMHSCSRLMWFASWAIRSVLAWVPS